MVPNYYGNADSTPLPESRPFEKSCCGRGARILCGPTLRFSSVSLNLWPRVSYVEEEEFCTSICRHLALSLGEGYLKSIIPDQLKR